MKRRCGKAVFKMMNNDTKEVFVYVTGRQGGVWWRYEDGHDGIFTRPAHVCTSFKDYMQTYPRNNGIYREV